MVRKRWSYFFSLDNFPSIIVYFLLIMVSFFMASAIKSLYLFMERGVIKTDHNTTTTVVCSLLLFLPIMVKFFPSVSRRQHIINKHYPLPEKKAANFELWYALFSSVWTYCIVVFSATIIINNHFINLYQSCSIIFAGIIGLMLAENFICAYHSKGKLHLACLLTILIITLSILCLYPTNEELLLVLLTPMLVFCYALFIFFYEKRTFEATPIKDSLLCKTSKNPLWKTTINRKKFVNAVVLSILFQFCFTIVSMAYVIDEIPSTKYYIFSSVFLYSYCFNNLWGFFPSVALNIIVANRGTATIIKYYSYILLPALLLQLLVNVFLLSFWYQDILSFKFVMGSLGLLVFITALGVYFSFVKAKKIREAITLNAFDHSSSLIPLYLFGAVSLIMGLIENTAAFWPFATTVFLISVCMMCLLLFNNRKERLLSKLVEGIK